MTMFNNLDVDKDFNLDVDFKINLESRADFEVKGERSLDKKPL